MPRHSDKDVKKKRKKAHHNSSVNSINKTEVKQQRNTAQKGVVPALHIPQHTEKGAY